MRRGLGLELLVLFRGGLLPRMGSCDPAVASCSGNSGSESQAARPQQAPPWGLDGDSSLGVPWRTALPLQLVLNLGQNPSMEPQKTPGPAVPTSF